MIFESDRATLRDLRRRVNGDEFGGVYFARAGGFVKIGESGNPLRRIESMSIDCPFPIALLGVDRVLAPLPADSVGRRWARQRRESEWHERMRLWHHRGEWFNVSPELLAAAEALPPLPVEYRKAWRT